MRILWTRRAEGHLEHIQDVTRARWPGSVVAVTEAVHQTVQRMAKFPLSGREGVVAGTREAVLARYPFTVVYVVDGEYLVVLGVFHHAQTPAI